MMTKLTVITVYDLKLLVQLVHLKVILTFANSPKN